MIRRRNSRRQITLLIIPRKWYTAAIGGLLLLLMAAVGTAGLRFTSARIATNTVDRGPISLHRPGRLYVPSESNPQESLPYLTIGMGSDPVTTDPQDASDNISAIVNFHMYETLVSLTPDMEIVPLLATAWTRSNDGLAWVFTLRDGIRFHDGRPLNAAAAVASFRRLLGANQPRARRSVLAPYVDAVEAVGDLKVRFHLRKPLAGFLYHLTHGAASVIRESGTELIGTGPFCMEKWVPGEYLKLRRFPEYWGEGPFVAGLTFVPIWDNASRVILLEGGELDVIYPVPAPDVARLQENPRFSVTSVATQRVVYIGMNTRKAPFNDVRVRRALNHGVNREAIADHVLFGLGTPLDSAVAKATLGHVSVYDYDYDPARAGELLQAAGVTPQSEVQLWTPVGRYLMDAQVAEAVAGYLERLGLKVKLQRWEWGSYLQKLREDRDSLGLYVMGWVPATGQADWLLRPLFTTGSSSNEAQYSNPRLDELVQQLEVEQNTKRRAEMYRAAQEIINADAPWIFLYSPYLTLAQRKDVSGIIIHSLELLDFRLARIEH